jgi:hypothetical protein
MRIDAAFFINPLILIVNFYTNNFHGKRVLCFMNTAGKGINY